MQKSKIWGFDSETFLITNSVVPRDVCWTFYNGNVRYLFNDIEGEKFLQQLLRSDAILVAQNACFDLCVASVKSKETFTLINDALNHHRIYCTKLAQILINSADPQVEGVRDAKVFIQQAEDKWKPSSSISMEGLAWKYLGYDLSHTKNSSVRTGYGDLYGVPVEEWSHQEQEYAKNDAVYVRDIFIKQLDEHGHLLKDLSRQTHVEYILQMMATVFGVEIDNSKIEDAVDAVMEVHDELIQRCPNLYKLNKNNDRGYSAVTKTVQEYVHFIQKTCGIELEITKTGKVSTNKNNMDTLFEGVDFCLESGVTLDTKQQLDANLRQDIADKVAELRAKQEADSAWKEKRTFLDALKNASLNPDNRLRYNYNGLMETGRTSSRNPNLQNIPRKGKARACIKPREGHIFLQADYSNAELRTLAQAHLNEGRETRLGEEYIKNPMFDPHLFMALDLLRTEGVDLKYDDGVQVLSDKEHTLYRNLKEKRQLSKIANFGYAGGLGAEQFVDYAKGYGTQLSHKQSQQLRDQWMATWTEMKEYFDLRSEQQDGVYHFKSSNRARYLRKFTIGCNTPFQGIASDGAKEAIILVWNECFFQKDSPLYQCVPILFVHDELVLEIPRDRDCTASAMRLKALMEQGMQKHTPDIPAIAEPTLTCFWTKDAESSFENGTLSIYEG